MKGMNLKEKLIDEKKTRWLDIGCGGIFEDGFYYLDTFQPSILDKKYQDKYIRLDIVNAQESNLRELGKFDFLRMQHVFEHFSYEEGKKVLTNCSELLSDDGYILITVPDLRINIEKYLNNGYKEWQGFKAWALNRIPEDAPESFYFSIFAYSMPFESHKWCYDFEGLRYVFDETGLWKNIVELKVADELSGVPFTHNRPEEDVCILAQKK
jgi:predicted SAM-dependent methyltransferase